LAKWVVCTNIDIEPFRKLWAEELMQDDILAVLTEMHPKTTLMDEF
jgi:hypothetical protein